MAHLAADDFARPGDDGGYTNSAFVEEEFTGVQRGAGRIFTQAVILPTVVTGEHDDGIVGQAQVSQRLPDRADAIIKTGDHRREDAPLLILNMAEPF